MRVLASAVLEAFGSYCLLIDAGSLVIQEYRSRDMLEVAVICMQLAFSVWS